MCSPQREQAPEILLEGCLVLREPCDRGSQGGLRAMRQHEGLVQWTAPHLVEIADVNKLQIAVEPEGLN